MTTASLAVNTQIKEHSLAPTIALHLLPGALGTAVYVVLAPPLMAAGLPALGTLMLSLLLVTITFEIGCLVYEGLRANGRVSVQGVVLNRERIPVWQFVLLVPALLTWAVVVLSLTGAFDRALGSALFGWLPDWFFVSSLNQFAAYSRIALWTTFWLGVVLSCTVGPIVEEHYFRGYLLPKLSSLGRWAPVVNTVLFALYHLWTPWQSLSRMVMVLPLVSTTWWKRNLYPAMIAHCLLNTIAWILTFSQILR
jgi:uncharacterized protein